MERGTIIHTENGYRRHFGYIQDPPHKRTQKDVRAHLEKLGAQTLPDVIDYRPNAAHTMDQGQTGSCGGHGEAQLIATAAGIHNIDLGFVPSPSGIYGGTRRVTLGDPAQPLTDSGVMPSDLQVFVQNFGVRPIQAPTPDGRYSDVWGPTDASNPNVDIDPDFQDLETSGQKIIMGEYRIIETDPNLITTMRTVLAVAKAPIGIGVFVDSQVMDFTASSPAVGAPNYDDPNGGGHWICIDGYRKNATTGLYEFSVHNSWSSEYGDNGWFWASEAFVKAASDLYAGTIALPIAVA